MGIQISVESKLTDGQLLTVDVARVEQIAAWVGVPTNTPFDVSITIVLQHMTNPHEAQGFMLAPAKGKWVIVVNCMVKETWSEKALYSVNNTLVHELRHVGQALVGIDPGKIAEIDAAVFGRLAHEPQFCAISPLSVPPQEALVWACDVCGPVEIAGVIEDAMGSETVWLHADPSCTGTVEFTVIQPSDGAA